MEKKVNQKETLKKILHRIRKYWLYVVLSITAASVSVALTLYLPILTGNAIDHILEPGNVDFEAVSYTHLDVYKRQIRYGLISHRLSLQKEWAVWKRQRRLIIFMEMRKV